jgi:N-acetylglucosamine-6-sulfatase
MERSGQIQHQALRRQIPIVVATVVALAVVLLAAPGERAEARKGKGAQDPPPPNIVLIMTDDQPAATVLPEAMPRLFDLLIDPGTSFSDYVVTTPLCCPSRATTLTGQYGHNNGILRNNYDLLRGKRNLLPVWLQKVGYQTAHLGKFMNGYEKSAETPQTVAPGWDRWFTQLERRKYYHWKASKNGRKQFYGTADEDHLTDVMNRLARRWAGKLASKRAPFYLQLDYFAPHGGAGRDSRCRAAPVPAPRDEGAFDGTQAPRPPSFNEADVSDKPSFIRSRPLMDEQTIERVDQRYRCTLESLLGVDRGIAEVHRKIAKAGELNRTIFIFTSDNGYFFGEHRIPKGKEYPYDENVRMPLTILVPPAYRDEAPVQPTIDTAIANVDLAPTILDLAGAEPCRNSRRCRTMDGRSLMPLLDGSGGFPDDRAFLIELFDCSYRGVRTEGEFYLEHGRGPIEPRGGCKPTEIEHYDLGSDPFQLDNLYPAPRRSVDGRLELELVERMDELSECAGIAGRDPAPKSGAYCE